jgi:ATP-dependent helicase Lhr and Lhr-like helicase
MSAFDQLHPAVAHHIVNSLGWRSLRPLQEAAIAPILAGEHALLLAPTAGGKTEAAVLPVLSRALAEDWRGLGVLYLCPIKALLNNLEPRLNHYAALLGRRAALWHGDVGAAAKGRLRAAPPDLLLTTPESLEGMLVSPRVDQRRLFADLHTVIIDELHAFAGDDRGWHLLYLLERLTRLAGRELQRLGLSATVGNPRALCDWLAGGCARPASVLDPTPPAPAADSDVELDWVGSLENAALVISRLHRGEKRLVFCDSRARVEQLALALRARQVQTFVSHSSLSLDERRAAEHAFAQGSDCVIVATSTLELGIDVGDLDRVIQIDAPGSVAAFLQRIGRTGRRPGSRRNCLFLATREDAFLQAAALLQLWREGYVEPVTPPPLPLHIFAQQIMALALQQGGITGADWPGWLGRLPGLSGVGRDTLDAVIAHMIGSGILHGDQGVIGLGAAGERQFGRKHFLELLSVFASAPLVRVLHGRRELGEVHQSTFMIKDDGPAVLTLAGRAWRAKHIDWPRRVAYVEPTDERGRSRWLGTGQPLGFALCQAMTRVLAREDAPVRCSRRALALLQTLRERYAWATPEQSTLVQHGDGAVRLWTFAGKLVNAALAQALRSEAATVRPDNLAIAFAGGVDVDSLGERIRRALAEPLAALVPLDADFVAELKFGTCLPPGLREQTMAARYDVNEAFAVLSRHPVARIQETA